MQTDYTMEPHILENPYHFRFIHLSLTRDLGGRFPELKEEVIAAFSELVPPTDSEKFILVLRDFSSNKSRDWTTFPAWLTGKLVVLRVVNRLFVGPSLCTFVYLAMIIALVVYRICIKATIQTTMKSTMHTQMLLLKLL